MEVFALDNKAVGEEKRQKVVDAIRALSLSRHLGCPTVLCSPTYPPLSHKYICGCAEDEAHFLLFYYYYYYYFLCMYLCFKSTRLQPL
jgi:hypothetical protein